MLKAESPESWPVGMRTAKTRQGLWKLGWRVVTPQLWVLVPYIQAEQGVKSKLSFSCAGKEVIVETRRKCEVVGKADCARLLPALKERRCVLLSQALLLPCRPRCVFSRQV